MNPAPTCRDEGPEMTADERIENARAAQEAREATAARGGGGPRRTETAMKRYLASESFREKRREDRERSADSDENQDQDRPQSGA